MKALKFALFIQLIVLVSSTAFAYQPNESDQEWILLKTQSGVSFYYVNKVSKVNGAVNTIIKVENTNTETVNVKFTPSVSCDGQNFKNENEATVSLAAGQHSLYTYKGCESNQTPIVKLANTDISK